MPFSPEETAACRRLIALAMEEDLGSAGDLTSQAVIPPELEARMVFVARSAGILAGLPAAALLIETVDSALRFAPLLNDGSSVAAGDAIATLSGPMRGILAAERTALNFLQHLSGIATLTRRYVDVVAGLPCNIMDTRKTIPGWRRLAKYAVRCGGGCNQRMGLYDSILIKDNHLAAMSSTRSAGGLAMIGLVIRNLRGGPPECGTHVPLVEIEVESLEHLGDVLASRPDIVLLDNMSVAELRQAVVQRNVEAPEVLLEASGGVNLATVRAIAESGVDRISVGALTHSAPALDIALDFAHPR
jgi:nicotinate-nucleotide pyrophosphorylase (carboxylating)